jgi:hypothetical protein
VVAEEASELFALMAVQGDTSGLLQSSLLNDSNATSYPHGLDCSMDEINNVVAASHQLGMYCTSLSATS